MAAARPEPLLYARWDEPEPYLNKARIAVLLLLGVIWFAGGIACTVVLTVTGNHTYGVLVHRQAPRFPRTDEGDS